MGRVIDALSANKEGGLGRHAATFGTDFWAVKERLVIFSDCLKLN